MKLLVCLVTSFVLIGSCAAGGPTGGPSGGKHRRSHKPSTTTANIIRGYCDGAKITSVKCDKDYPYRTITGFCNSLNNADQGSAYSLFRRWPLSAVNVIPTNTNNIPGSLTTNEPRGDPRGANTLPKPRTVSKAIHHNPSNIPFAAQRLNHVHMQWGQFLDHDITLTPESDDNTEDCTECDHLTSDAECLPFQKDDGTNTCMRFVRSANGNHGGPNEQINQITAFIDASNVYGSEKSVSDSLRTPSSKNDGKLRVVQQSGVNLMPAASNQDGCGGSNACFLAGDVRNTEQLGLASMQTLWVWHHNKVVDGLTAAAPSWDGEKLFQEARRIIGALHQRIAYNEFLPITVGSSIMSQYGLTEPPSNDNSSYNPNCEATLSTEFATAAFRFGHSLVAQIMESSLGSADNLDLDGSFFNPDYIYEKPSRIVGLLQGQCGNAEQQMDKNLQDVLTKKLFGDLDLAALNIQRGRDHRIRGYAEYYNHFASTKGGSTYSNVSLSGNLKTEFQSKNLFPSDVLDALNTVYSGDIKAMDLFTGLLAEMSLSNSDGVLGFVGAHMVAEQFQKLKQCDRFFYSHKKEEQYGPNKHFRLDEIAEIRKQSLASVLCQHFDNPSHQIQGRVMEKSDPSDNPTTACSTYPIIDYSKFTSSSRSPTDSRFECDLCVADQCTPEAELGQTIFGVQITNAGSCNNSCGGGSGGGDGGSGGGGKHGGHHRRRK